MFTLLAAMNGCAIGCSVVTPGAVCCLVCSVPMSIPTVFAIVYTAARIYNKDGKDCALND